MNDCYALLTGATTFTVHYADESGDRSARTFTSEDDAVSAFLSYFPDQGNGRYFARHLAWDFLGWLDVSEGLYGYRESLGYTPATGHANVSITYTLTHTPGCHCHAAALSEYAD